MTILPNPFDSGEFTVSLPDEAAASLRPVEDAAADISDIGQIFVGARKLEPRFVLDEQAFMDAIEPPPLFLQRAG